MIAVLATAGALACAPPPVVAPASTQLITVVAPTPRSTHAELTLWSASDGCWRRAGGPWAARAGVNGLSGHHIEGDGTTPLGTFPIGATIYGIAPNPGVSLRFHRIVCGDWWDGDSTSPTYNTFRHVACGRTPRFRGDSEALWKEAVAYRYFAVIDYNVRPVVPGRGSAIFLHVDTGNATSGCVSLPLRRLVTTLRWLRPAAKPLIEISLRP